MRQPRRTLTILVEHGIITRVYVNYYFVFESKKLIKKKNENGSYTTTAKPLKTFCIVQ